MLPPRILQHMTSSDPSKFDFASLQLTKLLADSQESLLAISSPIGRLLAKLKLADQLQSRTRIYEISAGKFEDIEYISRYGSQAGIVLYRDDEEFFRLIIHSFPSLNDLSSSPSSSSSSSSSSNANCYLLVGPKFRQLESQFQNCIKILCLGVSTQKDRPKALSKFFERNSIHPSTTPYIAVHPSAYADVESLQDLQWLVQNNELLSSWEPKTNSGGFFSSLMSSFLSSMGDKGILTAGPKKQFKFVFGFAYELVEQYPHFTSEHRELIASFSKSCMVPNGPYLIFPNYIRQFGERSFAEPVNWGLYSLGKSSWFEDYTYPKMLCAEIEQEKRSYTHQPTSALLVMFVTACYSCNVYYFHY